MGLPLFATPILAAVFGARTAVVLISIPTFVANSLLLFEGRASLRIMRRLWPIALAGAIGTVVGLRLLVSIDQNLLAFVIAGLVFVVLFRGDRLLGDDPAALRMRIVGPILGALAGVLLGSTSIASPAVAGYFHAMRLTAREFVFTIAAIFEVLGVVQVLGLWQFGQYDAEIIGRAALALVPMLLAFMIGIRVRGRLDNVVFRRLISGFLALSALVLIMQGLRGLGVLP